LIVGKKPEANKPINSLAGWSYVAGTAYCNSIFFWFESAAVHGKKLNPYGGPNGYLITD